MRPPPPLGLLSPPPALAAPSAGAPGAKGAAPGPRLHSAPPPTTYCFSSRESEAREVSRHLPIPPVPAGRIEAGCPRREERGSRPMAERGMWRSACVCGVPALRLAAEAGEVQVPRVGFAVVASAAAGGSSVRYLVGCRIPTDLGPASGLLRTSQEAEFGGQSDFRWRGECVRGAGRVIPKETFGLPRGRCRGRRGCGCHFLSGVGAGSSGTIVLVGRRRRGCGPEP